MINDVTGIKKVLDNIKPDEILEDGFTLLDELEKTYGDDDRNKISGKAMNDLTGDKYIIKIPNIVKEKILDMIKKYVCDDYFKFPPRGLISELINSLRNVFNNISSNPWGDGVRINNDPADQNDKPLIERTFGKFTIVYQLDDEKNEIIVLSVQYDSSL